MLLQFLSAVSEKEQTPLVYKSVKGGIPKLTLFIISEGKFHVGRGSRAAPLGMSIT